MADALRTYAADWNGPNSPPPRLRLLLLADVDLASAGKIVEWAIQGDTAFDLCAVCGDFIPRSDDWAPESEPPEKFSAEEGEMSAILAQLENTVCRVVYVPGPLDPVRPSVRLHRTHEVGRTESVAKSKASQPAAAKTSVADGAGGAGGGRGELGRENRQASPRGRVSAGGINDGGLLQLTPTSKNLHCRELRLAPGLWTAGFAEETLPISALTSGVTAASVTADPGTDVGNDFRPNDSIDVALRALCRGARANAKVQQRRSVGGVRVPEEAIILLTRLGGPWEPGTANGVLGGASRVHVGSKTSKDGVEERRRGGTEERKEGICQALGRRNLEPVQGVKEEEGSLRRGVEEKAVPAAPERSVGSSTADGEEVASVNTKIAANRLRRLWRSASAPCQQAGCAPDGTGPSSLGGSVEGSGAPIKGKNRSLLLHVCAGPGAFLAVRQALTQGGRHATPLSPINGGSGSSNEGAYAESPSSHGGGVSSDKRGRIGEAGSSEIAGTGCRIGGTTVTALGSLRRHGAYCVVELDLPRTAIGCGTTLRVSSDTCEGSAGGDGGEGWSVASVKFGLVDVPGLGNGGATGVGDGLRVRLFTADGGPA